MKTNLHNNRSFSQALYLSLFFAFVSFLNAAQNDTILVDFGATASASPLPWNNVTNPANGAISDMINSRSFSTGIGIAVNDPFNDINSNGTTAPDNTLGIPPTASGDSFYGNTVLFNGKTEPTGGILLKGLMPSKVYTIVIFASRIGGTDNRESLYRLSGLTKDSLTLDATSNTSKTVSASLKPAADGTIKIVVSPGPNNNHASGFFYLGALKLIYEQDSTTSLTLTSPVGGEFWQAGKAPSILWDCKNLKDVVISYSTNSGSTWTPIDTVSAALYKYTWTVPSIPSTNCLVRLTSNNIVSDCKKVFQIAVDTATFRIVVLGSSTAAGTGPSVQDSAWVWRYTREIFQKNTRMSVTNLAVGGFSTANIIATGDTAHNITKALSLKPFAIILNLPSNDAANNVSVTEQLKRFAEITGAATDKGVKVWVTTTQPKNFTNTSQIQIQKDMRDSILVRYGSYAIDFWNGIAQTNGHIISGLDAGDGTHLNDSAHGILCARVMAKQIDTLCLPAQPIVSLYTQTAVAQPALHLDLTSSSITINFAIAKNEAFSFLLCNAQGAVLKSVPFTTNYNVIDISKYPSGFYFYSIRNRSKPVYSDKLFIVKK
jgi:hypothetical protein